MGTQARHWKAEGGKAEEKTFGPGRWLLDVEGISVKLFPRYIASDETVSVAIEYTPVRHQKGRRGNSGRLLKVVRQQLAQIPEGLDAVNAANISLPEEVSAETTYQEGAIRHVVVNAYERSAQARQQCIAYYGSSCFICHFDFGQAYGQVGTGYIHVHHLRQLADIGERYEVDPIGDLRPVCPNCHAIIHRRNPPYSIEEVQGMLT